MRVSNGIQASAWRLAQAQSQLGSEVTILSLGRQPHEDEIREAESEGVQLLGVSKKHLWSRNTLRLIQQKIADSSPRIFHLHSAFIPQHTALGLYLDQIGIPYCVKLGGNLLPEELARKPFRKFSYLTLLEKGYLCRARGLIAVSNREKDVLSRKFPDQNVELLPNAVIPSVLLDENQIRFTGRPPRGFFLGKKDVYHKGIDRVFDVAGRGGLNLDLYMIEHNQPEFNAAFERLCSGGIPPTLKIFPPVYGGDKQAVLRDYDYYIHASRWEVFGNSILEAMLAGKPVILSQECDLAQFVQENQLGIVVNFNADSAPKQIATFISDRDRLLACGRRARAWALEYSSPERVAEKSLVIYERLIRNHSR